MKNPSYTFQGIPDETERIAVTDVAQLFTAAQYMKGISPAMAVVLTCEENQIRFCVGGSTPTQGTGTDLGHILYVGQSLRLSNGQQIQTFSFINHTAQSDGVLQATFEHEPGF